MFKRISGWIYVSLLLIVLAVGIRWWFQSQSHDQVATVDLLPEVRQLIEANYYQTIELSQSWESVDTLVESLPDEYSQILDSESSRYYRQLNLGKFVGLGMNFDIQDEYLLVYSVLPGSPADLSGVMAGDKIIELNQERVGQLSQREIESRLRVDQGETIDLIIERARHQLKISPTGRQFEPTTASYRLLLPTLGYLKIYTFTGQSQVLLSQIVDQIIQDQITHLVIDLRGNSGGVAESSLWLANEIVPIGPLIFHRTQTGIDDGLAVNGQGRLLHLEVVVLVDRFTASEAEILAAALKDNGRAVVIGEKTYGKGLSISHFELSDGRMLQLATAEWLRPNQASVDQVGIEPTLNSDQITDWSNIPWRSVW